jgi:serine/threonine-protein kinase
MLGGDLSAIMLKALENEPSRRYSTVREFAADLRHYTDGRPVEARPQTALYRMGKFVRRRWIAVGATSIFVIGITVAAVVAALEARAARAEALKSEQVNRFLTEMVATNGRDQADVGKSTVEQMLEAADQRLEHARDAQKGGPLTLAVLHKSLAAGYLGQLRYDKVQFHLDRAIPVFRAAGDERQLAEALSIRARSASNQGHYEEADRSYQESLAAFRQAKNAPSVEAFETKRMYAQLLALLMQTRREEARALYDELVVTGERDPSIPRVDLALAMAGRGTMVGDPGKAEAAMLEALAIGRKEDPGGVWEFDPLFSLINLYGAARRYQAGKEAAQRLIDVNVREAGPESLRTAQARNIWAGFAAQTGEPDAAAEAMRESMRVIEKLLQPPSLNLWYAARNASNLMRRVGQYAEAERYARESLAVAQAAHLSDTDPRPANSWEALGRVLIEEKKYQEGVPALEKAEAIYKGADGGWTKAAAEMRKLIDTAQHN